MIKQIIPPLKRRFKTGLRVWLSKTSTNHCCFVQSGLGIYKDDYPDYCA